MNPSSKQKCAKVMCFSIPSLGGGGGEGGGGGGVSGNSQPNPFCLPKSIMTKYCSSNPLFSQFKSKATIISGYLICEFGIKVSKC